MRFTKLLMMSALFVSIHYAFAASVFKCEDIKGNVSFQDACPPGSKQLNQKDYNTTAPATSTKATAALTLYLIPGCDTCNQLKEFLTIRKLSFTEKNVADDVKLQNELKDLAGELQVPVLLVGDKVLSGYNRSALIQALTESGHITAEADSK